MNINGINNSWLEKVNNYSFVEESIKKKNESLPNYGDFDSFFKAAMDTMNETSRLEQQAQTMQLDYITGKSDDILSVTMSEQRAYTALNFTTQVTNKIIESYRQIMAMQI